GWRSTGPNRFGLGGRAGDYRRGPWPPSRARYRLGVRHARHFTMVNLLASAVRGLGLACRLIAATRDNDKIEKPLRTLEESGIPGAYAMDYLPREAARRAVRSMRPLSRRLLGPTTAPTSLNSLVESYRRDT